MKWVPTYLYTWGLCRNRQKQKSKSRFFSGFSGKYSKSDTCVVLAKRMSPRMWIKDGDLAVWAQLCVTCVSQLSLSPLIWDFPARGLILWQRFWWWWWWGIIYAEAGGGGSVLARGPLGVNGTKWHGMRGNPMAMLGQKYKWNYYVACFYRNRDQEKLVGHNFMIMI